MKSTPPSLSGAYARRALYTVATLTLLGQVGTVLSVNAQDAAQTSTTPALVVAAPDPAQTPKTPKKPATSGKDASKAANDLRVVPMAGQANATRKGNKAPTRGAGRGGKRGQGAAGQNPADPTALPPGMRRNGPPVTITPGGGMPQGFPGRGAAAPSMTGGTPFSFEFRGSDIANVLKLYAQMSGLSIATDPGLSGSVTIINPKPVTLDDAFRILQSVLYVRGFTAVQNGPVLSILPLDRASNITPLINPTVNEDGQTRVDSRNQVMTQVIPLENVDAETLARELKELISKGASLIGSSGTNALIITDVSSNVQRFITLVDALDKTSNKSELRTYPLRRAEATAIADIINNLFRQITTRGRGGQPGGQPGQPQFNPGGQPQQPQSQGRAAVVAVADSRTNSVIVVASPDTQEKIASDIINRLDDDDTNTLETKIRRINFADAVQVANLVSSVLSNARAGGTGAATPSFQQRTFGFNPFGGGGDSSQQNVASTDPFGKVVADPRTNSVLITASSERMKTIDGLIDQLDKEVPVEPTTFVFPLKNAQADDVAYALSQAFGTGNNNGLGNFNTFFGFGGGGGGNSNRRQSIQRRLSQRDSANNQLRSIRGRGVPPGPPNAPDNGQQGDSQAGSQNDGSAIPQGVQGVMTPQGFVPTQTDNGQNPSQEGGIRTEMGRPKPASSSASGVSAASGRYRGRSSGAGGRAHIPICSNFRTTCS